jgi:hypothetical protein
MSKKINQGLSTSHTPFHQGKSLISVVTLVAFITTTIWNPGVSFAMTPLPASEVNLPYQASIDSTFKFFIPKDLGKVESMDFGQGPGIVHIQTAHGHYEAQQKIRKILHHLDKNYGIRTLLVEGSAFKLRPEILNFFPEDPKRTMKVADRLAQQALVKGPELYLLDRIGTAEAGDRVLRPAEAYGIEDARIYRENGEAFVRVLTQKQKTEQFLRDMDEGITRLSAPHLSDSLRRFIRTQESFEKRLMSVDAWFSYLRDETRKNLLLDLGHPANQIEWPMMVRLFKIRELQKNLDLQQFGKEREKFLKAVERFIPEEGQAAGNDDLVSAARQVSVRPISFLAQIGELLQIDRMGQQLPDPETSLLFEAMVRRLPSNFNYRLYPNLCYFIGILLLTSEMKADRLMDESSRVAEMITSRLARTDSEKAIVALLKDYRLLQKLFALELLPEDYETILASSAIGGSSLSNGQNVLSPSSIVRRLESLASQTPGAGRSGKVQFSHLDELDGLFDSAMQFYAGVKARDLAMIGMVEKRLKETGVGKVAVVTGGFHARPFRDYFSSQGYTYALVTPKITDQDEAGHRHYIENTLRMTRVGAEPASNHQATNQASSHLAFHARTSTRETVPLMHTRQELRAMGMEADPVEIARMAGVPLTAINRAEARLTKQVADEVSRQVGSSQRALENIKQAPTFDELNLDVQNAFWEVFQNTRLIPDEAYLDDWYVRNRNALLDVLSSRPEARTEPVDESNETIGERMDRLTEKEFLLVREDSRLRTDGEHADKQRQSEIESALDKIRGSIRELYDLPREDQVIRRRIGKLSDKEFHLSIKSNRLGTNMFGLSREELADRKKRQSEIESALDKIRGSIRALHLRRRALREVLFSQANDPLPEIHNWKEINLEEHEYLADETLVLFLQDLPGEEFQNWVKSLGRLLESGKSLSETERKIGLYVFEELHLVNGDDSDDLARVALASRSEARQDRLLSRAEKKRSQQERELKNLLIRIAVKLVAAAVLGVVIYSSYLSNARRIEEKKAGKMPAESAPVKVDQLRPRSELRAGKTVSPQQEGRRDGSARLSRAEARVSLDTPTLIGMVIKIVTDYRSDQPFPLEARSLLWSAKAAIGNGDFEGAIKSLDKANVALAGLASDYTRRRIIQLRDVLSKRIARSENRSENGEDETIEEGSRWGKVFEATFYAGSLVIAANVPLLLFVYAVGRWANQMEGFTAVPFFLTIGGTTVILMGIGAGIFNGLLFVGKRFFGFSPLKTVLQDKGVSRRAPSEPKPESDDSVSRKRSEARSTSVLMEEMLFPTQLIEERWDLKQVINPFMLTLIREFYYGIIPERVREGIETGLNTAGQALRAMMEAVGVSPADATGLSTADRKEIFQRALEILGIRKPSVDAADVFVLGAELLKKLRENDGRGLVAFREVLQGSLVAVVTDSETLASINQILGEAGLEPYLSTQKLKNHLPKGAVVRAVLLAGETLSEEDNRLLRIAERNIIRMTQGMLDRFMLVMEQIVTAIMGEKAISRSA